MTRTAVRQQTDVLSLAAAGDEIAFRRIIAAHHEDMRRVCRAIAGVLETAGYTLLFFVLLAALILVVLGLLPDQESALYLTVLVLGLFISALSLLWLMFAHRGGTATASDEVELPAE